MSIMSRPRTRFSKLSPSQAKSIMRFTLAGVSTRETAKTLRIPYNQVIKELARMKDMLHLLGFDTSPVFSQGEYILHLEKCTSQAQEVFDFVPEEFNQVIDSIYSKKTTDTQEA